VPTLLSIETQYVTVDIQGRDGPPSTLAALGHLPRKPHLAVESTDGDFTLIGGDDPPALYEESVYWFVVQSKVAGSRPLIVQRDPSLIARSDELADSGIVAATVVYRRQVGLSKWGFRVGEQELSLELEVFPAKLDYDVDYEALVDDVADVKRVLALEYFRGTYRLGSVDRSKVGEPLEWITILRQLIVDLERSVQQVNRSPQRSLRYERQLTPLHQIRGATPSVVRSVTRGEGVGELVDISGVGKVHAQLPVDRATDTLDTFEHRWLRSRLRFVHARLLGLRAEQDERVARAQSRGGSAPTRLTAEQGELTDMVRALEQLIKLPVMEAATVEVSASFTSLQLQSGIGYGEAYRVLTALSSALGVASEAQPYSLSDLSELYEVWCFLKVIQVAREVTGAEVDLSRVLTTASAGLRFNLVKGARSSVTLRFPGGQVTFTYNPEYRMPTGLQRPDIVAKVRLTGLPEAIIALDAKYRLDASTQYVAQFGSPGAPIDAVNALHRYRDAIRPLIDGARTPIVVAGAALFPWQHPLSARDYGLRRSIDEVGIGALPFLPNNVSGVAEWLGELLAMPVGVPA
jgi:hypothetical protein